MLFMNRYLARYCKGRKVNLHLQKLSLDLFGAKTPTTYACGGWNKGQDSVILMGFVLWLLRGLLLSRFRVYNGVIISRHNCSGLRFSCLA